MSTRIARADVNLDKVVGSIAGLPNGATTDVIFDLGPDWERWTTVDIMVTPVAPSTGLSNAQVFFQDTLAIDNTRRCNAWGANTIGFLLMALTTANGCQSIKVGVAGRFCRFRATNADVLNDMGANASVVFVAHT